MRHTSLLLVCLCVAPTQALKDHDAASAGANPIRKVVTLLQAMQRKVTEEGEKEKEMHKNYMCYCRTNGGKLSESISAGESKTANLGTDIKSSEAELVGLKEALKQAQVDRSAAKAAIAEATALREKAAAAYAGEKAEYDANIGAITKAVAALEKGMAGAFCKRRQLKCSRSLRSSKTCSMRTVKTSCPSCLVLRALGILLRAARSLAS